MKYKKPPLDFEEQADLLLKRGLIANKQELVDLLKNVSYYRLSAYWYPFKNEDNNLKEGTSLEFIWTRYIFDRQIRILIIDAIERFEVAIKTQITTLFSIEKKSPFAHIYQNNYSETCNIVTLGDMIKIIRNEYHRSKEDFIEHFKKKYFDKEQPDLPLWMAMEIMSFGNVFTLYCMLEKHIQNKISAHFKIPPIVLKSWLQTMNYIRNLCAHHSRLWNRVLAIKPFIPRGSKHPEWHNPVRVELHQDRIFSVLTILRYILSITAPKTLWKKRLTNLLEKHSKLLFFMGFPENWEDSPIWKD